MKILVSAGNTQTPIDRVRCITNIFTGRTGTGIALHAQSAAIRSHCSHRIRRWSAACRKLRRRERWLIRKYHTFDDLQELMRNELNGDAPDALIHCAAVSDYELAGIYRPDMETRRQGDRETGRQGDRETGRQGDGETGPLSLSPCLLVSLSAALDAGKIKSTSRNSGCGWCALPSWWTWCAPIGSFAAFS